MTDVPKSALHLQHLTLCYRSNRRRILNEAELIEALKPFVDAELVVFDSMTFQEQVKKMTQNIH